MYYIYVIIMIKLLLIMNCEIKGLKLVNVKFDGG